jgi:hypothetical protein
VLPILTTLSKIIIKDYATLTFPLCTPLFG